MSLQDHHSLIEALDTRGDSCPKRFKLDAQEVDLIFYEMVNPLVRIHDVLLVLADVLRERCDGLSVAGNSLITETK
jgi:hypothetical protein